MKNKTRLDILVVERGIETIRSRAQARILAGDIIVDDHRADKPGHLFPNDAVIRSRNDSLPFVSRGGIKLDFALKQWPGHIKDAICIDVGASTGGFTDVLLQAGAKKVCAVDVGHGQLAHSIRTNPKVAVFERTHISHVAVGTFDPAPTVAAVDVSFISLTGVLPALIKHLASSAELYVLIKPQFEVAPEFVEKGGIVKDVVAREAARDRVLAIAAQLGLKIRGCAESPIQGGDGNVEYVAAFNTFDASCIFSKNP